MEENEEILDINEVNPEVGRPAFITVLCILTFVGTGLGLMSALWSFFTIGQTQRLYETFDGLGNMSDSGGMGEFYRWTKITIYLNLLGNILCLVAAILMWNLKKIGYFLYIPGQVIPLIGSFMVFSAMSNMASNAIGSTGGIFASFGMIGFIFGALFPIAFIIMYGVNLKHMK